VVECSGVSEPESIIENWRQAVAAGLPLMSLATLDTMVTVVDAGRFLKEYESRERQGLTLVCIFQLYFSSTSALLQLKSSIFAL